MILASIIFLSTSVFANDADVKSTHGHEVPDAITYTTTNSPCLDAVLVNISSRKICKIKTDTREDRIGYYCQADHRPLTHNFFEGTTFWVYTDNNIKPKPHYSFYCEDSDLSIFYY